MCLYFVLLHWKIIIIIMAQTKKRGHRHDQDLCAARIVCNNWKIGGIINKKKEIFLLMICNAWEKMSDFCHIFCFAIYRLPVYDPLLSHYSSWHTMNTTAQYHPLYHSADIFLLRSSYFSFGFFSFIFFCVLFLLVSCRALYVRYHISKSALKHSLLMFDICFVCTFLRENSLENLILCIKKRQHRSHFERKISLWAAKKNDMRREQEREGDKKNETLKNNYKASLYCFLSHIKHEIVVNQNTNDAYAAEFHSSYVHIVHSQTLMRRFA